jgi:hypothetical protein
MAPECLQISLSGRNIALLAGQERYERNQERHLWHRMNNQSLINGTQREIYAAVGDLSETRAI